MKFLKNIPTGPFTISAIAIGLLLIDDLSPAEQNSLGNWFMLIGQVLATNGSQQQVVSNASGSHIVNDEDSVDLMEKVRDAINEQINNLRT